MYTHFTGKDMDGSYGGLPQIGAGLSFALGDRTRFFISARYGKASGDPYHNLEGFSDADGLTLKALPLMIGFKLNASEREDFRLYLGGAFQYAFLWEDIPAENQAGVSQTLKTSGTGTGYYLLLGPEFPLGEGKNAVGLEFGYGGSKGDVTAGTHGHGVDLTGLHARIYFTLGL